jgi:hypothetical protein
LPLLAVPPLCQRESGKLYSQADLRRKSPDRERRSAPPPVTARGALVLEQFPRHALQIDAARPRGKIPFSALASAGSTTLLRTPIWRAPRRYFDVAGGAQNILGRHTTAVAGKLVAAERTADAFGDAVTNEGLLN